jgi:hypothetical protein
MVFAVDTGRMSKRVILAIVKGLRRDTNGEGKQQHPEKQVHLPILTDQ